jgi:hypothetical protein
MIVPRDVPAERVDALRRVATPQDIVRKAERVAAD